MKHLTISKIELF